MGNKFESYVILDTTKTNTAAFSLTGAFESYVILDTTKTPFQVQIMLALFESYVILDTTKTHAEELERLETGLRVMLFQIPLKQHTR